MMWRYMRRSAIQIEGEHSSLSEMSASRLSLLGFFFVSAFLIIALRAIDIGIIQGNVVDVTAPKSVMALMKESKKIRRGNIYDRHDTLLATTLKTPSLFADPALILEPAKVSAELVRMFPELKKEKILASLQAKGRFVWIKRNLSPAQQKQVLTLGQPGLGFYEEEKRVYPLGSAAAHFIGYTDTDGRGLSGVERGYDAQLSQGRDIHLSLDVRLQHAAKREAQRAISEFNALAGAAVVMDARTGEILAGVSLPDFDLNKANEVAGKPAENKEVLFNRLSLGVYELGSMFKIFSTSAFLETHEDGISEAFDVTKPIKIGRFMINDYKGKKRVLSVPEVFIFSSNIGTANMGRMVGGEYLHGFYKDLGLLDTLNFDVREVGKPRAPSMPWKEVSIMTASYGHGLSTTPVQMASAVSSVVNGGIRVDPKLLLQQKKPASLVRVLSEETSEKMRKLMRLVVTEGTGSKADVNGFAVGGKTGTAEKIIDGRYARDKLISSFVGAFPINDPRYVVMVMVDEPKGNKQSHGYATAGWVAAPAVGRIVESMASILGMPGDMYDPQKDISLDFLPYVKESYDGVKTTAVQKQPVKIEGIHRVSY